MNEKRLERAGAAFQSGKRRNEIISVSCLKFKLSRWYDLEVMCNVAKLLSENEMVILFPVFIPTFY